MYAVLGFVFGLAVLGDFGLRRWFEDARYDLFAATDADRRPLCRAGAGSRAVASRVVRASPVRGGGSRVLVLALELLALDGRMFQHLGVSLRHFQNATVTDPQLLDTLAALSLNGLCFYGIASTLARYGSDLKGGAAWLLFSVCPFAVLEPLAWLVRVGEYARAFDWVYLAFSIATALVSHRRQRKSFYYAGVLNSGAALWLIADHRHWFDKPAWAVTLIGSGSGGSPRLRLVDARATRAVVTARALIRRQGWLARPAVGLQRLGSADLPLPRGIGFWIEHHVCVTLEDMPRPLGRFGVQLVGAPTSVPDIHTQPVGVGPGRHHLFEHVARVDEVDVPEDAARVGWCARRAHQRENAGHSDRAAEEDQCWMRTRLLEARGNPRERHVRPPVDDDPHRAVLVEVGQQDDGLREVRVGQVAGGHEQFARGERFLRSPAQGSRQVALSAGGVRAGDRQKRVQHETRCAARYEG